MNNDDEAKQQVEAFILILRDRYGMSEQDMDGVIRQLVALNRKYKKIGSYADFAAHATIVIIIGGFLTAVGWGIVRFIQDIASSVIKGG